ncbi:uncharacterized protein LOC112568438 isoform X1 [Pomacea canaliculata]|uniref:uncharacterized protein LOC112568438 isoform X1 n=1 Tax=Pomacea canaliculata TaxID=400727 RepID=UPI000D7350A9|nr:uncharacterized protein LOC112568438 isoform X1 [Pomacea canaliculata]
MTSLAEEFLSKRRERKPNFSDAEIGIILEGVCEHKDVLSHQENSITLNKQKMDVYNQITTKVNRVTAAEYGGSVLRTPKEVKKKWMELKFTALKIHNSAVDTDTEQKHVPKESPHTQLVLDILSGKARSGTTDFQLGYNSSNRSCPGKVGDSESDLPVSLSSFPSADDSENSECIVSDGESSIDNKHQQNLPVVKHSKNKEEQTLENPASEDQDLNTPSSETENIISDVFSHLEIETLLREVNKHRSILLNGDQQSASGKQQHKVTWELITESVRKASKTGILPTISQIQRLWRELKCQACKELKASRNDKTLDGKAHIWPRYTDQVLAILDGNCDDISDVQGLDFETMMSLDASSEQELSLPQQPDRYVLATSEDQLERKRRTRKPNFTEAEVSCMLDEIPRHYRILLSTPRTGNILRLKQKRWQMIAERVSKVSDSGVRRSWREVRKKFKALCTFAQANKNSKQSDNPSYLSCSKDSKFFQRVLEIQAVASIGVTPPEMEDFDSVEMEVEKERQKMEMEDFDSVEIEVEKERQTETLLKRRRERKKNFTNDDIKHLIEECCKHRSALVVKERDELTNRRRNQAWRIITETVNKKMKGVRRTAKELKKKFMDMKFAVVQYTNCDESESDAPWRKPPPYFSQLVTFLSPSKEDTQGLGNENYCDLENEFIIAANEDKSSTDNTSSVDNSANDDRTSDDCDHSSQDATVSGTVEGTDALSLQQSSHHWESPLEHYSGKKKRNRKPNFTAQEIACILDVWNANRELLSQKHSNMAVVSEKYKIFQMMADKVNQSSDSNTVRTALEVKKKWKHLKFVAVKAWLARQDAISKGKKPPKKVPFMNRIVENISGESMLDHDQDDKSTEDSDSDIGTRAERAKKDHGAMVKRHMKRLSDICEKLRACGVRAGAIIIEPNGIMSCGEEATRISKLPEVAAVISGLPCATEPQTDESVVCGGWRYTSLEKVREHPVTLAVESKEENDFKDGSSGEDIPKVELAAKLLVKSDEEGSEEFDDNRSSDEDCKKHILSQNVSMTRTDDQELILDVKEKLRLLLQNRPMSMEEELTDSQHMPTEEKDQKNVATPPKEMETNIATSLSDIDHCTITVKTEKEMNYICGWCNKMFLELSSFMLHTQQEKYLRVCCSKCDSKFCDLLDLRQHEASAHEKLPPEPGEKNPIVVLEKLSESTISTATNCQDPSPQPSRQGRFGCSECGLCFLKMDILLQHRRTHTQERPFGCTLCDLRFKLEATLDAHKKMHANQHPIQLSCMWSAVQYRCRTSVTQTRPRLCQGLSSPQ